MKEEGNQINNQYHYVAWSILLVISDCPSNLQTQVCAKNSPVVEHMPRKKKDTAYKLECARSERFMDECDFCLQVLYLGPALLLGCGCLELAYAPAHLFSILTPSSRPTEGGRNGGRRDELLVNNWSSSCAWLLMCSQADRGRCSKHGTNYNHSLQTVTH